MGRFAVRGHPSFTLVARASVNDFGAPLPLQPELRARPWGGDR